MNSFSRRSQFQVAEFRAIRYKEERSIPVDSILGLYRYAPWAKGRNRDDIQIMLEQSDLVVSVWDHDRLVGFGRALTDRVYRANLYDIVVHPDYRRQGLGRSIVEFLLTPPLLAKVPVVSLFTRDKEDFYKKLGFVTNPQKGLKGMILVRGGEVYQETLQEE